MLEQELPERMAVLVWLALAIVPEEGRGVTVGLGAPAQVVVRGATVAKAAVHSTALLGLGMVVLAAMVEMAAIPRQYRWREAKEVTVVLPVVEAFMSRVA